MRKLSLVTAAVAMLFAGIPATAGSISITQTFATGLPVTNLPLTFAQFNPTMGTLTSVDIELTAGTSGSVSVNNQTPATNSYNYTLNGNLTLLDPLLVALLTNNTSVSGSLSVPSGGTVSQIVGVGPTANSTDSITSGLGTYTGLGTVSFFLSGLGGASVSGATPFTSMTSVASQGTLTVTYNFSSVPEPVTAALAGIGLLGLGLAGRLRKRKS